MHMRSRSARLVLVRLVTNFLSVQRACAPQRLICASRGCQGQDIGVGSGDVLAPYLASALPHLNET